MTQPARQWETKDSGLSRVGCLGFLFLPTLTIAPKRETRSPSRTFVCLISYEETYPSSSMRVLISTSRAHCFSVGSFRGIVVATVTIESSLGLRSCRCRAHAWSARQYAGPSSTTRVWICMPVMTLCCTCASFFVICSSSRPVSSLPSSCRRVILVSRARCQQSSFLRLVWEICGWIQAPVRDLLR